VESRDLIRDKNTFSYRSHQMAIWLLNLCGFECITDEQRVYQGTIYANLRCAFELIEKSITSLIFEFSITQPQLGKISREEDALNFINGILRFVNKVLKAMYGLSISKVANQTAFHLRKDKLFILSKEGHDTIPNIPSNLLTVAPSDLKYFIEMVYYESTSAD
jgi:hypothetical protein